LIEMNDELFIIGLGSVLTFLLAWGFKKLPAEKWQFIAAVPMVKVDAETWSGMNLTYYGFFSATAYVISVAVLCILLSAINVSMPAIFAMTLFILIPCVPASRLVASLVERKKNTFTVQGASFVGIMIAPWMIWLTNQLMRDYLKQSIEVVVILSAIVTIYAMGEGIGRLACISFGCCYGKPVSALPPFFRKAFHHLYFVFYGSTKKIAYADGLEGMRILPVQAITAVIFCATGITGVYLFLKGHYTAAFLGGVVVTQTWRFASEFVRADHRGGMRVTAYQIMGLLMILYCFGVVYFFPVASIPSHNITAGLSSLWNPAVILFLQALWVVIFIYTGRSRVTKAFVSFRVIKENI